MTSAEHRLWRRRRSRSVGRKAAGYAALTALALFALGPFLWTVSTSLKNIDEIFVFPPQLLPSTLKWSNYTRLWHEFPMARWIFNSAYIVVLAVLGKLFLASTAAYAFARLRWPGRDYVFYAYLTALMIPWEVTLIPGFVLMRQFGWIDSHLALIVPSLGDVFGTFLLRQFFLSLPRELEEAARIDGAGYLAVFCRIILPLSKSALAVVAVLGFMSVWNAFLWPLIMIDSTNKFTLPVGLQLLNSQHGTDWSVLMAGDVIALIPVLIVYLAAQKHFVQGITMTARTG
ncbi:MAG: carbohydrate ABC transporter permease [Mycobacteriales bacterium]|nr:MAG: sugar ABC transporter permease [Pseudonocardiales bacterium]